jgi:leader peptidase (prepilin peptidase)/N-methyltransferase
MLRILGTVFAALSGLAFGSFLNVCLSRWPEGESIVHPRSHCRSCNRTLAWWENVPLLSWLALGGRCRTCKAPISWRYPLVEAAVGALWAIAVWQASGTIMTPESTETNIAAAGVVAKMIFYWLLVALAALDAEHLWLPDRLTLPAIVLGFAATTFFAPLGDFWWLHRLTAQAAAIDDLLAIAIAAGLVLFIRWIYWLIRRREGIGLGDAKLLALLAAWLGLPGALLAFVIGVVLGAAIAVVFLIAPASRKDGDAWALTKLPLGTFLCVGGIVSDLWGQRILAVYLRWAGF